MAHDSPTFERPCTRAFTAELKRKALTSSSESADTVEDALPTRSEAYNRKGRRPMLTDANMDKISAKEKPSSAVSKKPCSKSMPSGRAQNNHQQGTRRPSHDRQFPSCWEADDDESDTDELPMNPNGSAPDFYDSSGVHLLPPLTPDYYQLFDIDPKAHNVLVWDFFHDLCDKASAAVKSITTRKHRLTEAECFDIGIEKLKDGTPPEQLQYCQKLLAEANEATNQLLWHRRRYDDMYHLVRSENEEFAYRVSHATGSKHFFRTIYERIECSIIGEERGAREQLKLPPVNYHRLAFPDVEDDKDDRRNHEDPPTVD